jgi:hypothetical protein
MAERNGDIPILSQMFGMASHAVFVLYMLYERRVRRLHSFQKERGGMTACARAIDRPYFLDRFVACLAFLDVGV